MYICNILCVTKKPPNIFIAAKNIAKNPNILDISKLKSDDKLDAAIIATSNLSSDVGFKLYNMFGFVAIVLAAINIFGGFLVTQRMLKMYKKKKKKKN